MSGLLQLLSYQVLGTPLILVVMLVAAAAVNAELAERRGD